MTYKEIVNRIQTIVNEHYMLADFGYGDLSDLKTRFENTSGDSAVQADYPYLFLNPATHTRNMSAVTYNFNMIVMDVARGEVSDDPYNNMLTIQSQCQQYIDDVIAKLWDGYRDQPAVLYDGLSYNTFNERFQDDVAGMTVNLQITVPQALNNCIAPFIPDDLKAWSTETTPYTYGEDGGEDPNLFANNTIISGLNQPWWWSINKITPTGGDFTGRIELTMGVKPLSATGSVVPQPWSLYGTNGGVGRKNANTITGWPTVADDQIHEVTMSWDYVVLPENTWWLINLEVEAGITANITVYNPNIKLYV